MKVGAAHSSGLGVRVTNVRRSFDAYLADKTRTSQSDYEMLNDFVSKLSDLENMLLPSESDLGVFIGRFFDTPHVQLGGWRTGIPLLVAFTEFSWISFSEITPSIIGK